MNVEAQHHSQHLTRKQSMNTKLILWAIINAYIHMLKSLLHIRHPCMWFMCLIISWCDYLIDKNKSSNNNRTQGKSYRIRWKNVTLDAWYIEEENQESNKRFTSRDPNQNHLRSAYKTTKRNPIRTELNPRPMHDRNTPLQVWFRISFEAEKIAADVFYSLGF